MRVLAGLLGAVLLTSCGRADIQSQIEDARTDREVGRTLVAQQCPKAFVVEARCGLISRVLGQPSYREAFVQQVCGGVADANCDNRYGRMLHARLELRYKRADFATVIRLCDAEPRSCNDLPALEERLRVSHNENTLRWAAERKNQVGPSEEVEAPAVDWIVGAILLIALHPR